MADAPLYRLIKTRIREGVWEGSLRRNDGADGPEPRIDARHLDQGLDGLEIAVDGPGRWVVRLPIPATILNDGVQTVILTEVESGERLAMFTLVAGEPLDEDIRAEVDLLRAELDMLKRAFRRHCVETT